MGGLVGPEIRLDEVEKRKISPLTHCMIKKITGILYAVSQKNNLKTMHCLILEPFIEHQQDDEETRVYPKQDNATAHKD
jgi:hypothetical protein